MVTKDPGKGRLKNAGGHTAKVNVITMEPRQRLPPVGKLVLGSWLVALDSHCREGPAHLTKPGTVPVESCREGGKAVEVFRVLTTS